MALKVIKNTLGQPEIYAGPHCQVNMQQCWHYRLQNPLLNTLYKDSISYTERWYLETRRLINEGLWGHPLLASLLADPVIKSTLINSTVVDSATMLSIINNPQQPEYQTSAAINLRKLKKWHAFFVSLPPALHLLIEANS
jgi:hypothetical protein